MLHEIAPTAGLPLVVSDLVAAGQPDLEQGLAQFLGVREVQLESSGTAALIIALSCLKKTSKRKTVVIPGYTCPLVPIAIAQSGLNVRLCDNRADSYDFDPEALRAACDDDTLAVIPTHFSGLPADVETAMSVAKQAGAYVIEDAAQSLGAKSGGAFVGTSGDVGIFSLSCGKGLTIYQGGFLVAKDAGLRKAFKEESQRVSPRRLLPELIKSLQLLGYGALYNPVGLSITYGMPLRAALEQGKPEKAVGDEFPLSVEMYAVGGFRRMVGASALARLPDHLRSCRERGRMRSKLLSNLDNARVLVENAGDDSSYPFLTVLFDQATDCQSALDRLWTAGLGVTKLFVHALTGYQYLRSILPGTAVPNAESFAARTLTITNSAMLTDEQFAAIAEVLKRSDNGAVAPQQARTVV